jgi:hypothetical protein
MLGKRITPWVGLELIPPKALRPGSHYTLPLNPNGIEIGLCQWPASCVLYGGSCHSLPQWKTIDPAVSVTLIDTYQSLLVTLMERVRYVTLSYVWGRIPGILEATTKNFEHLCTPGALKLLEIKSHLPGTVSDVALTRMMGLQYVWVDRLCIIQDGLHHFGQQLQQMAAIYANAYFTIISVDGSDANHGLQGLWDQSTLRTYKPASHVFTSCENGYTTYPETRTSLATTALAHGK